MSEIRLAEETHNWSWKDLYIAALFESDKSKIAARISEAQVAISVRRRKLFAAGEDASERQALDTALFSLQALKNCFSISSPTIHRDLEQQAS